MRTNTADGAGLGIDVPALQALRRAEVVARLARFRLVASRVLLRALPALLDGRVSREQIDFCADPSTPDLTPDQLAALPAAAVDEVVGEIGETLWPTMLAGWLVDSGNAVERDLVSALRTHCGLPCLVTALEQGRLHDRHLDATLRAAKDLSVEQLRRLDLEIDDWGSVTLQTFKRKVAHAVLEIATPTADERAATIAESRCVLIQPESDGSASLTMRGPAPQVLALHNRLSAEARKMRRDSSGEIADPRTLAQLRFDLLTDAQIAEQNPEMLPAQAKVQVTVPVLTALGECDTPAEMLGFGPIDAETARRIAEGAPVWERILTDAGNGHILPSTSVYDIPQSLRRHVHLRNQFCTAPGCSRRAQQCEVDHVIPFNHEVPELGGRTEAANLHPLCKFHHQAKTDGRLEVSRHEDHDGRLVGMLWRLPGNDRPVFVPDDVDDSSLAQVELLVRWEETRREALTRQREREAGLSPPAGDPPEDQLPTAGLTTAASPNIGSLTSSMDATDGAFLYRDERFQRLHQQRWPKGPPGPPDEPPF